MKEKIIVYPVDFSDCSKNAMPYVKAFAKACSAKVVIVHSLDLFGLYSTQISASETATLIKTLEESSNMKLDKIKEEFEKDAIKCETELNHGTGANWLHHTLEEIKPFLVVMGTTGSGEVENRIFGSLTHKIISKASFPVLAVPENAKYTGIHQVVFATDFKEGDIQHIKYVIDLTRKYTPKLDVVHVAEGEFSTDAEESILKDFEDDLLMQVDYLKMDTHLLYSDDVESRLNSLVKEVKADLMVLVSTERTFFERIFAQSLTKKMVYHSDTPLLVF